MVIVLAGLSPCFPFLAPFAWVIGNSVRKDIEAHPNLYSPGPSSVGRIIGMVLTIVFIALIGIFILALIAAAVR